MLAMAGNQGDGNHAALTWATPAAALLVIAGCASSSAQTPSSDVYRVLTDYSENAARANLLYNDKRWVLTDVVPTNITDDYASMATEGYELRLFFRSRSDLARLARDETYTVECEGDGLKGDQAKGNQRVEFEGCVLPPPEEDSAE